MRPSPLVTPRAMTAPSCSSETATPAAGRPLAVSRTCVERVAIERPVSYARDDDAPHHGRTVHFQSAVRGEGRAEDVRRDPEAPPAAKQDCPLPVERRIDLGPDGGEAARGRFRKSHEPPGAGPGARLSGRLLGDGDPVPLRRDDVLEQGGAACREPLRDGRRRQRTARGDRSAHALGRRAGLQHQRRVSDRADVAIRGATVVSDGAYARDILITDGRISALVEAGAATAKRDIDAHGLFALPGVVDAHVHFNEPGRTDWEGWSSGSRAAAAGGTTTVLDMPLNSIPPVLDGASFDMKKTAAENASIVDFGLWGGLVDADPASLRELAERGAVGVKAFLCDSGVAEFPALREDDLVPALRAAADANLVVALHCEDDALVREATARVRGEGRHDATAWSESRPPLVEIRAVAAACAAAREAGAQSLLSAVFSGVAGHAGGALDVQKVAGFVVWRLAARPAKRFGLWPRKGAITQGSDADIVLFDPEREWTVNAEGSRTRGVDPYVGRSFRGKVVRTLVAGRTVYNERETVTNPVRGRFIQRGEVAEE